MKSISRRSFVAGSAGAATLLALAACGGNTGNGGSSDKTYKVGVLQLTEHSALDAANKGFIAALDESGLKYEADQQNAQNDQSACATIASKFVGDGKDLIFVIATPAAQAVAGATSDIPIVGTAITDYAGAKLVKDNAKKVGLLFASNEANSEIQIEMAEAALDKLGLSHDRYTVSNSNELQSVVESMVGKVDAVYSPTDNTIAAGMAQVGQIAKENKLPIIPGEKGMCEAGGLCTLSIDYTELGHMAGEMAVKILKGESKPEDMAIEQEDASKLEVVKNDDMAQALGIDLSVLDS